MLLSPLRIQAKDPDASAHKEIPKPLGIHVNESDSGVPREMSSLSSRASKELITGQSPPMSESQRNTKNEVFCTSLRYEFPQAAKASTSGKLKCSEMAGPSLFISTVFP